MTVSGWVRFLDSPTAEDLRSRVSARVGGFAALCAAAGYLGWRATATLPPPGQRPFVVWVVLLFEALPLLGLLHRLFGLWSVDSLQPPSGSTTRCSVAVLIPTLDEPAEVVAPTIAAACELQPQHETWVLDDGDRPWLADICRTYGARYVTRSNHEHAKAGNLNHALDVMREESAAGAGDIDVVAVLDCDHIPLPHFLSSMLPWFADHRVGLVQAPQGFYNAGAFDDDRRFGEQGLFFNVQMRARSTRADSGPFWCGSSSLVRTRALEDIGGVATDTIAEDLHTTLRLLRHGWRTAYHHQTVALGLAPSTAQQYLLQRRRWALGAMQVAVAERLWNAWRWLGWRNYLHYLTAVTWWLEGIGTVLAFGVPVFVLLSGASVSTAAPLTFVGVFTATFAVRLWGSGLLLRNQVHWPTAVALRVFRIPLGLACAWWLVSRRQLRFVVTPKGSATQRKRGDIPAVLFVLGGVLGTLAVDAALATTGVTHWGGSVRSRTVAGSWLCVAAVVLLSGMRRVRQERFASSRRAAHRFPARGPVLLDNRPAELIDLSITGASIENTDSDDPGPFGLVELTLPGAAPVKMMRSRHGEGSGGVISLQCVENDWHALRVIALWLFHTPPNAIPWLPIGIPAAALRTA